MGTVGFGNISGGLSNNYFRRSGPGFNIGGGLSSKGFSFGYPSGPSGPRSPKSFKSLRSPGYLRGPGGGGGKGFPSSGRGNNFLPTLPPLLPSTPTLQP